MLGNCEQMVAIPPTTNQWPQIQISAGSRVMEKPGEEVLQQQQQQQEALKCPRCDSSNTKFCYYNNYSLSQPRHFCKACKRYWTRGGTLRNVPVGGGCRSRSNKRLIKRPITTSSSTNFDTTNSSPSPSPTISTPQIDTASSSSNHISPVFYGLSSGSNSCDVNLPFSRFNNYSRISSSGFDFQPQMNATGLCFSSGLTSNNNTLVSNYGSVFRSSTSASNNNTPVMLPSLLNSNLLQHKLINHMGLKDAGPDGSSNTFQGLASLDQLQMTGVVALKDMKGEGSQNRSMEWNGACQNNKIEHVGLFDPSLYWNTASSAMGVWKDQPNIGPSVTSLI